MRSKKEPTSRLRAEFKGVGDSLQPKDLSKVTKKIKNYTFRLCDMIGKGSFSTVYRGHEQETEEVVAVKVVELQKIQSSTLLRLLQSEVDIIKSVRHPNILRCHDVYFSASNCYIVTQFCNGGDIRSIISRQGVFSENEASKIVMGVYEGLRYLRQHNIVHRDLKTANVFMKDGQPKIADFGFSKRTNQTFKDINIGSPLCMSPEGIIDNIYGPKTDVWAFGIFLFQLFHGKSPFEYCKTQSQLKQAVSRPVNPQIFKPELSYDLKDLILSCLEIKCTHRISTQEIQHCPYIRTLKQSLQSTDLLVSQVEEYRMDVYNSIVSTEVPIPTQRIRKTTRKSEFDAQEGKKTSCIKNYRNVDYDRYKDSQFKMHSPKETRNTNRFQGKDKVNRATVGRSRMFDRGLKEEKSENSLNLFDRKLTILSTNKNDKKRFNNTTPNQEWTKESSPTKLKTLSSPRTCLIQNLANFQDILSLLHYCRVLFKCIKQCETQRVKKLDNLGCWLFKILDQILLNINKIKQPPLKISELKDIVFEYGSKYRGQLPYGSNPHLTITQIQSTILQILEQLQTRSDPNNQCLVNGISYMIFVYDLNEILYRSISSHSFREFTEHNQIEQFLSAKEIRTKHIKTLSR